jgi:hypothetical protein
MFSVVIVHHGQVVTSAQNIVMYWGFYSRWMFISTKKLNKLQLTAMSNSPSAVGLPTVNCNSS